MARPIAQVISLEKFHGTDWSTKTWNFSTSNNLQYMVNVWLLEASFTNVAVLFYFQYLVTTVLESIVLNVRAFIYNTYLMNLQYLAT